MVGTLKALARINAPLILMQLVCFIFKSNSDMTMNLDMVEYFAGCMAVPWDVWIYHFRSIIYEDNI